MGQLKLKRGHMHPSGRAGCLTGCRVKQNPVTGTMCPSALLVCASSWGWP